MAYKILIICLSALFLSCVTAFSEGEQHDLVNQFVQTILQDKEPTLADYYKFYGEGDEAELALTYAICDNKGWKPVFENKKCLGLVKKRQKDPVNTPSLYLSWVRSKLPLSPKVVVEEVIRKNENGFEYETIDAYLNTTKVKFFRPLKRDYISQFGLISLTSIDEVPVKRIFKEYLRNMEINYRFAGQYFDQETGLHYNYFRYYDPKTGRYLTPDPIGLRGGMNLYSYTSNNPINRVDLKGLFAGTLSLPAIAFIKAGGVTIVVSGGIVIVGALSDALSNVPYIPSEDEAEDILQDILEGNYPAPAMPMSSPNDDIYDGWDWWKDNVGEVEKCEDDRDYCDKVLEMCREECLDLFVNNPDKLPGTGRNLQARQRRCIRDCMERNGCSNF